MNEKATLTARMWRRGKEITKNCSIGIMAILAGYMLLESASPSTTKQMLQTASCITDGSKEGKLALAMVAGGSLSSVFLLNFSIYTCKKKPTSYFILSKLVVYVTLLLSLLMVSAVNILVVINNVLDSYGSSSALNPVDMLRLLGLLLNVAMCERVLDKLITDMRQRLLTTVAAEKKGKSYVCKGKKKKNGNKASVTPMNPTMPISTIAKCKCSKCAQSPMDPQFVV